MAVKPALNELFGSSPLSLIERHAQASLDCVKQLVIYFEAAQRGDWKKAEKVQEEIVRLEEVADDIKMEVRMNLPRGLWMSVSRADLLDLVRIQDAMANETKDIAGLSLGRNLAFPETLNPSLFKYLGIVIQAAEKAIEVVAETRQLSRSAFGARQVKIITSKCVQVEKLERRSDKSQQKIRANLRACEEKIAPVDVIFLYQLLSQIGEVADHAEKVAHRAQIIASS